jgi:hypothetical protein
MSNKLDFIDRVKAHRILFEKYGSIYWYQHHAEDLMSLAEEMAGDIKKSSSSLNVSVTRDHTQGKYGKSGKKTDAWDWFKNGSR